MIKHIVLLIVAAALSCSAQTILWTDITSQTTLPSGVKLFKGQRATPALNACYLDVDLTNPKIMLLPYLSTDAAGKETIAPFVQRVGAIAGINGGYFGSPASSYSAVIDPSGVKAQNIQSLTRPGGTFPVMRSLFSIDKNRTMSVNWIYHFGSAVSDIYAFTAPLPYINNDPAPRAAPSSTLGTQLNGLLAGIGGGPSLVKNNTVNITFNEELFWGSGVATDINSPADPRTAVGSTAAKHAILLVADGRGASLGLTLSELARVMLDRGCVEAMNLDGGGSTQMAIGGSVVDTPSESRQVPSMLAVVYADSLHLPKAPVFEKMYDTNAPEFTFVGPGWFQSANAGYFGSEKAQLNPTGTGGSAAVLKPRLQKSGVYEVYGWWVDASNRSTETPFIVRHKYGVDTVRVNQTTKGAAWNLIGSYTFAADTNDAVTISNYSAKPNSSVYVVADGLRLVSYDQALTSAGRTTDEAPAGYALKQNYPNPFNPSTHVRFSIAAAQTVSVTVFDVLGREIAVLVSGVLQPGTYTTEWNAAAVPSGIYLYRLQAGGYSAVKKLVIQK